MPRICLRSFDAQTMAKQVGNHTNQSASYTDTAATMSSLSRITEVSPDEDEE
jgi:hypothetical protein